MAKPTLAIIGLGLMGGSFALGLKQSDTSYNIVGYDHNAQHAQIAKKRGIVDATIDTLDEAQDADIIVLAVPVDAIIQIAQQFDRLKPETTVIDLGSTKAKISESIPKAYRRNYVTAHPMTGTEKFGPESALPDLYKGKVVVICDLEKSGEAQRQAAQELFEALRMQIVYMESHEHDRHAAFISHMPHAVSFALANAVMRQEDRKSIVTLAGGGFKDMSRIAKSNPSMWEDIFRQNKTDLLEAIYSFEKELKACRTMIENEEWERLHRWMKQANTLHDIL